MRIPKRPIAAALMLGPASAAAAPQTFNTALPVAEGEWIVRVQAVVARADAPGGAEAKANGAVGVLAYGIDGRTAAFVVLPWLDKSLKVADGSSRGGSGIGDLALIVRRTLYAADGRGYSFRIAPVAGVELPTGKNRVRDASGVLPPALQPGSGSVDPFAGVIATFQTLDVQVDGQLAYQANRRADGFAFGDVFRADASVQYRLWPRDLANGLPNFVYATLDASFRSNARDKAAGRPLAGTSARHLTMAPGLQYVTRRWIAEAAVQMPIWQDVGPLALDEKVTLLAGFRVNF